MAHLLHLDSSARGTFSMSRQLGRELVESWLVAHPEDTVTYRDLDAQPLPFVSDSWVAAAFTPEEVRDEAQQAALDLSEQLLAELRSADVLVVGAPMYNFGIPAALKAWVDQVVRLGQTFVYGPDGRPVGVVQGKRAIVLGTSGTDADVLRQAGLDFRTGYLRAILGFIGITDVESVEHFGTNEADIAASLAVARSQIADLVVGVDSTAVPAQSHEAVLAH